MANYKGVNRTLADNPVGDNILDHGLFAGKLRVMIDNYVMLGTEAAGEHIKMGGKLPVGARVIEVILHTDDLAATCTLDVGDAEDVDRYMDGVDCGGGAQSSKMLVGAIDGRAYKVDMTTASTPDNQILITFATLATPTADADIKLIVLYVVE